jgi:hypothetical protein
MEFAESFRTQFLLLRQVIGGFGATRIGRWALLFRGFVGIAPGALGPASAELLPLRLRNNYACNSTGLGSP